MHVETYVLETDQRLLGLGGARVLFVSRHILQTISQHRRKNYIFVRLPF